VTAAPPVGSVAERRTRPVSTGSVGDDVGKRVRCSAGQGTEPDVLRSLARDPSVTVRAALAMNPAAPPEVNIVLAGDHDEKVRLLLASKLAALLPGLSQANQTSLYEQTWATLSILVEDEVTRIRAIIAEAAKDLADAPHDVVLSLARDPEVSVYEPVIRLSPLLTTDDLISLITDAPGHDTVTAVANRPDLAPLVSDAIAASADAGAIRALLDNPTAHIREATLDALVARSVEHPEWHEPLVRRPSLPTRTARILSEIVATHLLEILAARADLPQSFSKELRARVVAQLTSRYDRAPKDCDCTTEEALGRAHALAASGELGEETLMLAARRGEARYAAALLAAAAGAPISVIDRAALLRSAKGMVSLVWKAGFTMRAAVAMQYLLARLPPSGVLMPGPGDSFPLAVEEMRWQLDFLGRIGR
jgi:uncharacterized protein (DUF2336 family)